MHVYARSSTTKYYASNTCIGHPVAVLESIYHSRVGAGCRVPGTHREPQAGHSWCGWVSHPQCALLPRHGCHGCRATCHVLHHCWRNTRKTNKCTRRWPLWCPLSLVAGAREGTGTCGRLSRPFSSAESVFVIVLEGCIRTQIASLDAWRCTRSDLLAVTLVRRWVLVQAGTGTCACYGSKATDWGASAPAQQETRTSRGSDGADQKVTLQTCVRVSE